MIRTEDVYKIGKIGKPHGVKGEVNLLFTDDVFDRMEAEYLILEVDGILVPFFMEEYRFRTDERALVKFCDINTQERAQELTNCDVYFPRQLSDSADQQLSWAEICGYQLIDSQTGDTIGKIRSVDDSTLNILFEVCTKEGKVRLIPAAEDLIETVDSLKRTIHMSLPDGLLDIAH